MGPARTWIGGLKERKKQSLEHTSVMYQMAAVISSPVELFPIILVTCLLLQYLRVLRKKAKYFGKNEVNVTLKPRL